MTSHLPQLTAVAFNSSLSQFSINTALHLYTSHLKKITLLLKKMSSMTFSSLNRIWKKTSIPCKLRIVTVPATSSVSHDRKCYLSNFQTPYITSYHRAIVRLSRDGRVQGPALTG